MASTANRHKEEDGYGQQERVYADARVGGGNGEGASAQYGRSPFVGAGAKPQLKNPMRMKCWTDDVQIMPRYGQCPCVSSALDIV